MKKIMKVLMLMAFISATTWVCAQEDTKTNTTVTTTTNTSTAVDNDNHGSDGFPAVIIGFRYMPTFSSFDYHPIDNSTIETSAVLSHGFGGFIGVNLTNNIGLQGEVIYSPLAQKYKSANRINHVKINYINIPLLLRINTGYDHPVNLNFVFGPQFGFNTGSSVQTDNEGATTELNAKLAVKKSDVGIAYGAGLDFGLGGYTKLGIGFRGVYGLVDISDNSKTTTTDDYYVLDKAHVKTYSAYIGIAFGF